ncbi:MAG: hypothetical protein A3G87_09505 [Omnitrophica bacterium RIFCSPLOWO2_12_FULL_50_11]|nr:MAG: hypothetical protein A3G87_09505 [Omnitrophica bacterium RIFCSPLOWO2_12_FULL_50_11]
MKVEKDYVELLELFNKHNVRYCIVGAYAVAFYGRPRYTKDLDILIEPVPDNARRLVKALDAFGFKSLKLKEEDFTKKGNMIQLGYEPIRIDLLTSLRGFSFASLWKKKRVGKYGKHRVLFSGKDDLIRNKKLSGRNQDLADLEVLRSEA